MSRDDLLLTILVPSRRIKQLEGLIESLEQNTKDLSRIQLIVKCDDDQLESYKEIFARVKSEGKIDIRWVSSPRLFGPFTMWLNLQLMWKMVPKKTYFVFVVTDEGRFIIKDWDEEIAQYKGYYKDDIFRLRLSVSRDVNYYNINQTIFMPDCFPVYTRKWLEITEGFGDCWGSDAYQESIAYHLGRGTGPWWFSYPKHAMFRDLVLNKRLVGGIDEFAQDLQTDEQKARSLLTMAEWKRLVGRASQTKHCQIARRLLLEIKARELNLSSYTITDDAAIKTLLLHDSQGKKKFKASYAVPFWFTGMALLQFTIFETIRMLLQGRHHRFYMHARVAIGKLYRAFPDSARDQMKRAVRQVFAVVGTVKSMFIKPVEMQPNLQKIFNISGIVGVQHGKLFQLEGSKLAATPFMLENLKKSKFVTCTPEELTYWIEQAYGDEPAKTASSDNEEQKNAA